MSDAEGVAKPVAGEPVKDGVVAGVGVYIPPYLRTKCKECGQIFRNNDNKNKVYCTSVCREAVLRRKKLEHLHKAKAMAVVRDNEMQDKLKELGDKLVDIDPIADLTWIYQNILTKNPDVRTAPSPGAYAHLRFIQDSKEHMEDFYTKVYPRLIPAKSQIENMSKKYDDNRTVFDLLERLSGEVAGDTK